MVVTCPSGSVLSGGFKVQNMQDFTASERLNIALMESYPLSSTQWAVYVQNGNAKPLVLGAWAVCATVAD